VHPAATQPSRSSSARGAFEARGFLESAARGEPSHVGFAAPPGRLSFGVPPRRADEPGAKFREGRKTGEICERLAVADGVGGRRGRPDPFGFFQKSVAQHRVDARRDALVEFVRLAFEVEFHEWDAGRTRFGRARVSRFGCECDFERPRDAISVARQHAGGARGSAHGKPGVQDLGRMHGGFTRQARA
jgi:hypothetical protein